MTETEAERKGQKPDAQQEAAKQENAEAAKRLLADSSTNNYLGGVQANSNELSGINSTAAGRILYVTGEGLAKTPQGMWNSAIHNVENPMEFAKTAATGLAFGVGMRLLLPQQGAMKALVGTAMSYFFIKDAAMPVMNGWKDAANARDMAELHTASTTMGEGLGTFGTHSIIGLGTGIAGEKLTGVVMNRTASGRAMDAWKDRMFNSEETAPGRFFKWSERTADGTSDAVAARLLGQRRGSMADDLTIGEKLAAIEQANKHHAVNTGAHGEAHGTAGGTSQRVDLDHILAHRKRYRSEQFSERLDELLGTTPAVAKAGETTIATAATAEGIAARNRMFKPEEGGKAPSEGPVPGEAGKPGGGEPAPKGGEQPGPAGTGDGGRIIITDAAAVQPAAPRVGDMNAGNVGDMAVSMRRLTGQVTKEDIVVAQAKEDIVGPLSSTMRSGQAPLDAGHFSNNNLLLELTGQIKTADHYRSAGMLLDHFRTANQQVEIAASKQPGTLGNAITDLNQYSRSVHAQILKALDDNGIPRDVVRGSNSPLFTIRDSDGAGPYTIPAIKDPRTGKPVTDAAVVAYPREYHRMEGVHTSGVYAHELGHDLIYGDLLKFPQNVRDNILTQKVVGDAMKSNGIADVDIAVPGAPGGTMKKSEFFVQVLKAQANENTADMFGTSIDPNTGLSLAVLLASLRKPGAENPRGPGLLENRSMYSKEMVDAEMHNHLGIEVHGIDRFRLKLSAQTLRELSDGHKGVLAEANKLDLLADTMTRPGNEYVWANADAKGQYVAVAQKELDAIIPALVQAQFNTKLEALNGHTLRDIAPKMSEVFPRVDTLAESMADAAIKGQSTVPGFNKAGYRIEEVFSAGLSGWMKAVAKNQEAGGNVSADVLMARINQISENLRANYRNDNPETILTAGKVEPLSTKLTNLSVAPFSFMARQTGRLAEQQPRIRERVAAWTPAITGYAGAYHLEPALESTIKDLLSTKAVENQVLNSTGQPTDRPNK